MGAWGAHTNHALILTYKIMTTKDDGGPAFPVQDEVYGNGERQYGSNGMTLRDWFAGMALQGIIQVLHRGIRPQDIELMSRDCYGLADAMLAARKEEP